MTQMIGKWKAEVIFIGTLHTENIYFRGSLITFIKALEKLDGFNILSITKEQV